MFSLYIQMQKMNNYRKFIFISVIFAALLFLPSCSEISTEHEEMTTTTAAVTTITTTSVTAVTTTAVTTVTAAEPIRTEYERIAPADFSQTLEAEDFELFNGTYIADDKGDYSGQGYVDGFSFSTESGVTMKFQSPSRQYYDFSFYILSTTEDVAKASVKISENEYSIEISQSDLFTEYRIENVLLSASDIEITVLGGYNDFCLDRVSISNNKTYKDLYFDLSRKLCNDNATDKATALFEFICNNFMQKTMTGQFASSDANNELELIYQATGYYPLIRMGDLGCYSLNGGDNSSDEIAASLKWNENGGVVSLMWHWLAPTGEPTVYAENSTFDLNAAISDIADTDIAHMDAQELSDALENQEISPETYALVSDIDNIAQQLCILKEANVPVLWRPLHEAGNGVFWWGAFGSEAYLALWELMFERMTEYHELDNLIWVWNGQSGDFLVPEDMYDIASIDIYTAEPDSSSQYKAFALMHDLTSGKKVISLSECSTIPDIAAMLTDGAVWSSFGLWYGEYIADEYGRPYSSFNSKGYLTSVYSSVYTLTLADGKDIYAEMPEEE